MAETEASVDTKQQEAAPDAEAGVLLYYPDDESNQGPGEFVMHGANLYFKRGMTTGPVAPEVADLVTSRRTAPVIRVATEADIKAASGPPGSPAPASETKETEGKGSNAGGSGTTGPNDTAPESTPESERQPKPGTKLGLG